MAWDKYYWIGSAGPFMYDSAKTPISDPGAVLPVGQKNKALITDDQLSVGTQAIEDKEVLRLIDVGDIVGDVVGPGASTDNAIVRFDGVTGKKIQNSGVLIDDSDNVNIPTGQGLQVNGIQVVTDQQAAEADVAAVSAISLGAGSDQVDRTTFNTDLGTLVTEINAIKTKLNNLLAKLRTHGLIDT
jgi:hypothetical protein